MRARRDHSRSVFVGILVILAMGGCDPNSSQGSATAVPATTGEINSTGDVPTTNDTPTGEVGEASQPTPVRICVLDRDEHRITSATLRFDVETVLTTDEYGCVDLAGTPGERVVGLVEAPGYAPASAVVPVVDAAPHHTVVHLLSLPAPVSVPADQPAAVVAGGVTLELPAQAALDPETGEPVVGDYQITIVPLDPAGGLSAMPGPLIGLDADDSLRKLESYFMAEVALWQDGKRLALDPTKKAVLRYAIAPTHPRFAELAPGQKLPAWHLQLDQGRWLREGEGTIHATPEGLEWVAEVSHFSWWNADVPWTEKNCVEVSVLVKADPNQPPVPVTDQSVPVTAEGVDYAGFDTAFTNKGVACLELPVGKKAKIYAGTIAQPIAGTETIVVQGDPMQPGACGGNTCEEVALTIEGMLCTPNELQDCYTHPLGPDQMAGVGICTIGNRLCVAAGFFEACTGDDPPALKDICKNNEDDDCNGAVDETCDNMACNGNEPIIINKDACWSGWPEYHFDYGAPTLCKKGVWTCDANNMFACGTNMFPFVWPTAEIVNNINDENCNGWPAKNMKVNTLSGPKDQVVTSIAASNGFVYVAGFHEAPFALGNLNVPHDGDGHDLFVAAFNANDLTPVRAYRVGSKPAFAATDMIHVVVDEFGMPFVAGFCTDTVTIDGLSLPCDNRAFVAKLQTNAALVPNSLRLFGDDRIRNLAVAAANGRVHVLGDYADPNPQAGIFFGANRLASSDEKSDIFYFEVDPQNPGVVVPRYLQGEGPQVARAIVSGNNAVHLAGFVSTVTHDTVSGLNIAPKGAGGETLVVSFTPGIPQMSKYTHIWGAGRVDAADIAVTNQDRLFVAGSFANDIKHVGADELPVPPNNAGADDIYVASFIPGVAGQSHLRTFGSDQEIVAYDLATLGAGVALAGHYRGAIAFDDHPMSTPSRSGFVVRFDDTLAIAWARELSGVTPDPNTPDGMVVESHVAVGGTRLFTTAQYTASVALDTVADPVCLGESDSALIAFSY